MARSAPVTSHSLSQIGIISATLPLAQIAGVVLLGVLFDRRVSWRKPLFALAMTFSACFYVALPLVVLLDRANAFAPSIVFAMCAWAINAAAVTLMDAMAVERTAQNEYGQLRLFGALGYGIGEPALFFCGPTDACAQDRESREWCSILASRATRATYCGWCTLCPTSSRTLSQSSCLCSWYEQLPVSSFFLSFSRARRVRW